MQLRYRVALATLMAAFSFILMVGAGFGAKTGCTTQPVEMDLSGCDRIDTIAWIGFAAATVVAVAVLVNMKAPRTLAALYAASQISVVLAMGNVTP